VKTVAVYIVQLSSQFDIIYTHFPLNDNNGIIIDGNIPYITNCMYHKYIHAVERVSVVYTR